MMTYSELEDRNRNRVYSQISYVTKDVHKAAEEWTNRLQIGPWRFVTLSNETCHNAKVWKDGALKDLGKFKFICAICNSGNMQFELIEPVYGETIYSKFLEEHGEGLHHFKEKICCKDWASIIRGYEKNGVHISMCGAYGNNGWAYLDTEEACIMELGDMLPNDCYPDGSEVSYFPEKDNI